MIKVTFPTNFFVSESTFLFWKLLSKSDFGKCENAFPSHLPKQLSQKKTKLFMCDMALQCICVEASHDCVLNSVQQPVPSGMALEKC